MKLLWTGFSTVIGLSLIAAAGAQAQTGNLRCYQMKDPLGLKAVTDLTSELGFDAGCRVSKAKQFCEQTDSNLVSAMDKVTGQAITMLPISGPDGGEHICYKVSCPAPAVAIPGQEVSDRFGTRTLTTFKSSLLCTPALKGPHRASQDVTYQLQIDALPGMAALPTVEFEGGQGLRAVRSVGKNKGDSLPSHTRSAQVETTEAYFVDGEIVGSTDGWADWYQQVQVMGEYCATHTGDECNSAWVASDLGRGATLSAIAAGGEVLATWRLADAWPAGLTLTTPDSSGMSSGILRLTLAAAVEQFSFPQAGIIPSLFEGLPPAAVTPTAADGDAELENFFTRYHDLEGALRRLNGLQMLALSASPPSPPQTRQPRFVTDAGGFHFEVDGVVSGGFKEITGLESEVEIIEFRDGDDPITHKRAGKVKYKNIVLKRGVVNDASLLEWYKQVLAGQTDRKSGSIVYLDREGNEDARFTLTQAWPCRWKAPELSANSDTHVVEELEFCVERVDRG